MLTVHVRVNDAGTGRPTPVRLRVAGPDGTFYAPFGRVAEFAFGRNEDVGGHLYAGRDRWCFIDGACEIALPAGVPLRVQAMKGPEYRPLDATVTLGPGQMALRFTLERWADPRADGWVPGDTRAHFVPPHAALLEAAAEDLDVANLLACSAPLPTLGGKQFATVPNMTAFSGQGAALADGGRAVAVNTFNTHPALGRVGLLHSHRPVFPLTFGGDDDTDDWSVCDWCDQCHRKGGLAVWADAFRPDAGLMGGEGLVALVLGKIDAVELDARPRPTPLLPHWYRALNAGFAVPLAGGSGKDSNRTPLGAFRTYARVGARECSPLAPRAGASPVEKSPDTEKTARGASGLHSPVNAWVDAVRGGRTVATNGPLLTLDANGAGPGDELPPGPVTVRATAASLAPFDRLEVVVNGQVAASATGTPGDISRAELTTTVELPAGGWVAARCWGNGPSPLDPTAKVFAHTSPAYRRLGGHFPRDPAAAAALLGLVEQARDWVTEHGRFANPKRKQHLLDLCAAAAAKLGGPAETRP